MAVDWLGFGYAALVASGGVIGYIKAVASGALTGIMGMRFYNSGKFMPAGLVAGASPHFTPPALLTALAEWWPDSRAF
ncbi:transmembrane protein 14C-like isoform X3 [Chiloscyllium plagiosum]|uniref:transmembrane protein 14C-like isoform X3 n=1 Tax=Chiloscyllium plagiosum TaxID=36176 RepID=UPI001CB86AF1|nr:transmembrane protein 14C-like isoform X3 [Chiloscyllium plagiosum]